MRRFVRWGSAVWPHGIFAPPLKRHPGACPECDGAGVVAVPLDSDRYETAGPCPRCRFYCPTCRDWVKREGHQCPGVNR